MKLTKIRCRHDKCNGYLMYDKHIPKKGHRYECSKCRAVYYKRTGNWYEIMEIKLKEPLKES